MAGTAETRKGEGGALRARWPTERTDSQSARIFDSEERPAIETGQRRSPLAVTDTSSRIPGARLGYPQGTSSKGISRRHPCLATAVSRSPVATRLVVGDGRRGRINADPAARAAPDRTPRVEDRIRAATATGSRLRRPLPASDSILRPTDSPPRSPMRDRNISTDRCDLQQSGASQVRSRPEHPDSPSPGTMDCDEQPASEVGMWRCVLQSSRGSRAMGSPLAIMFRRLSPRRPSGGRGRRAEQRPQPALASRMMTRRSAAKPR